ncbi:MAG: aminotransferase class I/II-fold pyridoxal phosphate-dependent enzyme [Enterocloster sp.]
MNLEAYDRNRNLLYNGLKDLGFECIKPQGAFYLFVKSPEADERSSVRACKKYNILVVPGSSFACPGYVRVSPTACPMGRLSVPFRPLRRSRRLTTVSQMAKGAASAGIQRLDQQVKRKIRRRANL